MGKIVAVTGERGVAAHAVDIDLVPGMIAVGVGPMTGSLSKVEIEYGGQIVTQVPAGEDFNIKITYSASNPGASAADPWRISFTAMATDGSLKGREHADIYSSSVSSQVDRISGMGPMPDHDITLRVRLWGNQSMFEGFSPAESQW